MTPTEPPDDNDTMGPVDFDAINAAETFTIPQWEASESPSAEEPADKKARVLEFIRGEKKDPPNKFKAEKVRKPPPKTPKGGLKKALEGWYTQIGMALMMVDPHCGMAIMQAAPNTAEALFEYAENNPETRRILLQLCSITAKGKLITAHMPILLAVGMHHIPALKRAQQENGIDLLEMFANLGRIPDEDDSEAKPE